jgi:hypothetical protein
VAALSTAANQVSQNTKLDSLLTELGQKLEPADISLLSTAAKQDAAKAVFDTMSNTLSSIAGYVDGLEAAEASNLAKLEQLRLLLAGTLLVDTTPAAYTVLTRNAAQDPLTWTQNGHTYTATYTAGGDLDTLVRS